jgi:hypothetical protein
MLDQSGFVTEIQRFIENSRLRYVENSLNCDNSFSNSDEYFPEIKILQKISTGSFDNTLEQGNALENLVKSLFRRINILLNVEVTNREVYLGQIDIQLIPLDDELFRVWGLHKEQPKSIIGECKNYSKNREPVKKPEIEKTCWRACKGGCLSFFIAYAYTSEAVREISFFNQNKDKIFQLHKQAMIVPLTIPMIEVVVANQINFCHFIKWAITVTRATSIASYL